MNLLNPVLSLLFPSFCGICSVAVEDFCNGSACAECWNRTRLLTGNEEICFKCGRFHSDTSTNLKTFCRRCDEDEYDLARSCGYYENALAQTILSLKHQPFLPKRASRLLMECFVNAPFRDIDFLIPVPLSRKRYFERGFNQAEILAEHLSKDCGIPFDFNTLLRTSHTQVSRASMDQKGRRTTVKNAFSVRRKNLIRDRKILLIDDVFTSGATVAAAAGALKRSGAASVDVLTLARAGMKI